MNYETGEPACRSSLDQWSGKSYTPPPDCTCTPVRISEAWIQHEPGCKVGLGLVCVTGKDAGKTLGEIVNGD